MKPAEKQPEKQPETQDKQAKIKVDVNDTGEGIEIQQGVVELDVNVVQETVTVQVRDKTWFSISFSGIYRCLGGIVTCISIPCTKPQVVTQEPTTENPVVPIVENQPVVPLQK